MGDTRPIVRGLQRYGLLTVPRPRFRAQSTEHNQGCTRSQVPEYNGSMASGWLLVAGAGALGIVLALLVRMELLPGARTGRRRPAAVAPLTLGPMLVVLGIVFGDDRVVGYTLMSVGVGVSLVVAFCQGRR